MTAACRSAWFCQPRLTNCLMPLVMVRQQSWPNLMAPKTSDFAGVVSSGLHHDDAFFGTRDNDAQARVFGLVVTGVSERIRR